MSDFSKFAALVHAQFTAMSKGELFTVAVDPDVLYAAYLAAFPEGSNPVFRERTEHDCSCCRSFIKNIGHVVAIVDGQLVSVWDVIAEYPYDVVTASMSAFVKSHPIESLFRAAEPSYGVETSKELRVDGSVHTWNHFHGKVADKHYSKNGAQLRGDFNTAAGVFERGLKELMPSAFADVIELIEANGLYRGTEFLPALKEFQKAQIAYLALDLDKELSAHSLFVWANAGSNVARFRNTAIGTLIQDISEGTPFEAAVKSFEAKVAPTNYKRTTALITPRMVADAMKTINELGLEPALERRFATIHDITINNVLWADGSVKPLMKGGVESLLMGAARLPAAFAPTAIEDIGIADFMATVLPKATSIELIVKNAHQGNFMSLTAPVHTDVEPLFKWGNNFGWSYEGNITDSIKERVKAAGGMVVGDLCCRLAWNYRDDLDFHMYEPSGYHIGFHNRRVASTSGGILDLDANGGDGQRDDPAENIYYTDRREMKEGEYRLVVHNYSRRCDGIGFEAEIEFDGQVHHIVYDKVLRTNDTVQVMRLKYTKKDGFEILESLPSSHASRQQWGIATNTPVKVTTVMHSPNFWDGQTIGNQHTFFILDGCRNETPARGIYNEFLNAKLEVHRKVFEVLGDKTKCQPTNDQLSGVGFSSTKSDSVQVNVTGAKIRKSYNIIF